MSLPTLWMFSVSLAVALGVPLIVSDPAAGSSRLKWRWPDRLIPTAASARQRFWDFFRVAGDRR
jgi:hypothetical protein